MVTDPEKENAQADRVDSQIRGVMDAAEAAVERGAESALEADVPVLGLPVVRQVLEAFIHELVKKLGDQASIQLQQIGTFVVIDTEVQAERKGVSGALADLMEAEKSGDPARIQGAIHAYANAFSALAHSDGSATPRP